MPSPLTHAAPLERAFDGGGQRAEVVAREVGQFNAHISADDRAAKYDKMAASPFSFYRGTAHLYYRDLHEGELLKRSQFNGDKATTWLQGDMHIQNMGAFADDDGEVVFDLNDFDEAFVGSYLNDLWRAGTSIVLAARENGRVSPKEVDQLLESFGKSYLKTLADYRGNDDEKGSQLTKKEVKGVLDDFLKEVEEKESRTKMLGKWSTLDDNGERRFQAPAENDKLGEVHPEEYLAVADAIANYHPNLTSKLAGDEEYFAVKDVARRLNAGTGSLGTARYYVLIEGPTKSQDDDRLLDLKQQGAPSIFPYLDRATQQSLQARYGEAGHAARVVEGAKALGTDIDDHFGAADLASASFLVKERTPYKESLDTAALESVEEFDQMAHHWGERLATAHARGDKDFDQELVPHSFEKAIHRLTDGREAAFIDEIRSFSTEYADQVEADYQHFLQHLQGAKGGASAPKRRMMTGTGME